MFISKNKNLLLCNQNEAYGKAVYCIINETYALKHISSYGCVLLGATSANFR